MTPCAPRPYRRTRRRRGPSGRGSAAATTVVPLRLPLQRMVVVPLLILGTVLSSPFGFVQASWVDPDTPARHVVTRALTAHDDRSYRLVFSDEFEVEGRTFRDGSDPRWTAIHKNDYTNSALHFYSHDNANTTNGVLNITTESKVNAYKAFDEDTKKFYIDHKYVQTGMLQSWNKFCFVGGIVEFSAKLPGDPQVGGLWPALWMLGNLARATYVGSSDYMWPYSYNHCDDQNRLSQEISACSRVNHYNLPPFRGRGAPEIDVIEAMQGEPGPLPNTCIQRPYQSASLQVAPGVDTKRPVLGQRPRPGHWYTHLEYGNHTTTNNNNNTTVVTDMNHDNATSMSNTLVDLNPFFYGVTLIHKPKSRTYQADAISANLQLSETHYQDQHIYRVEWEPPDLNGTGGYVRWYTDDEFIFGISADSLDITGTEIPSEPMYLIMNTAVSSHWGFPAPCPDGCDCDCYECGNPECMCGMPDGYCDNLPASFEIDYVRVYQAVDEPRHILGCSPASRPSSTFIEGHVNRYKTENQRQPLLPVAHGGAVCSTDADCGGDRQGLCAADGTCFCSDFYTGPRCLSHRGYYDVDTRPTKPPLYLDNLFLPHSLVVLVAVLVASFCLVVVVLVQKKRKELHYAPIMGNGRANGNDRTENMSYSYTAHQRFQGSSYQHQFASPSLYGDNQLSGSYALPSKHKNITYCIIDERLVDN